LNLLILLLILIRKPLKHETYQFYQDFPFLILGLLAIGAIFIPSLPHFDDGKFNAADIAWILVATALVFLMTPGLAFFYGGMVHRKNVISTMIKSVVAAGVVSVLWVTVGYSLCFGESIGGFIGNPMTHLFFKGVSSGAPILQGGTAMTIPLLLFALFQLMLAIITPGLVVGAVAERIKFAAYILFIVLFSLLVYAPLAHWTWHSQVISIQNGCIGFCRWYGSTYFCRLCSIGRRLGFEKKTIPHRAKRNSSCQYPLCIDWHRITLVWLVWLHAGSHWVPTHFQFLHSLLPIPQQLLLG
jgi:hypothetical protein